jgi:hypothetical protein
VLADDQLGLAVLNPTGMFFNSPIRHDEGGDSLAADPPGAGGTWHWPERVD